MSSAGARAGALLAAAVLSLAGCGEGTLAREATAGIVTGTVLDASTGVALEGVLVEGPRGTAATSDETGRFVLRGLRIGDSGTLRAEHPEGGSCELPLAPLEAGRREVVFHLRAGGE